MASFTDEIVQFNPYIKTFATDAYVTAGIYKQQKYDQNVQKINSYIESLYGLPVARDIDRQYLESKINGLTQSINKSLSGADFSKDSLVNQVGAFAGKIASDRYVQKAVLNAAKMQKDVTALETAKKDNKGYSPANEYHLMKSINAYMNGGLDADYLSEGYIPYINPDEEIQKLWKDKKPNSTLVKRVGLDGSTGWVMLSEEGQKTITQEEVMREIESTLSPQLRKQLSIDAAYKYSGVDTNILINDFYKDRQKYLDENIKNISAALITADPNTRVKLQEELNSVSAARNSLLTEIEETKLLAVKNPDAVKDRLYYQNWLIGTSSRLSHTDVSQSNLIYKDYYDIMNAWYDNMIKGMNAGKSKGKGEGEEEGPGGTLVNRPITEDQMEGASLAKMKSDLVDSKNQMDNEWYDLATKVLADNFDAAGLSQEAQNIRNANRELYYDDQGRFITERTFNTLSPEDQKKYKRSNVARNVVFDGGVGTPIYTVRNKSVLNGLKAQLEKEYKEGNPNLPVEIKEYFDKYETQQKILDAKAKAINDIDEQLKEERENIPFYRDAEQLSREFVTSGPYRDKKITVTGADIDKFLAVDVSNLSSFEARQKRYQESNLPKDVVDFISDGLVATRTNPNPALRDIASYLEKRKGAFNEAIRTLNKREKELVREVQGIFNERGRVLEEGNTEDSRNISQIITYISGINLETAQKKFRGINWEDAQAMVSGKHREDTSFAYGQEGATGQPFVEITNKNFNKGKPIRIPLDIVTAQSMKLYENDPLSAAKQIMALKKGTTGNTIVEALPVKTGGKYKASYNLDLLPSGNYKLKLYLAAPGIANGTVEFIDNEKSYTEAELAQVLQSINDSAIENYVKHRQLVELGQTQLNPSIKPFSLATPMSSQMFMQGMPGSMIPSFPGLPLTNQ